MKSKIRVMAKKILTYTMLMLFVASTTSLPLSIKMCKMQGSVKGKICGMMNHIMSADSKECLDRGKGKPVELKITSDSNCCTTKTIDNSIKDNYITHESNSTILPVHKYIYADSNRFSSFDSNEIAAAILNGSPPGLFSLNTLYLSNSVLLI